MNIIVKRKWLTHRSTIGEMWIDGVFACFTLEPPKRDGDVKPRAIPVGSFVLTIRASARFKRMMPHVENVPGFEAVEIHWGNFAHDTEACLLVGQVRSEDFIGNSRVTFIKIMEQLEAGVAAGPTHITYIEEAQANAQHA